MDKEEGKKQIIQSILKWVFVLALLLFGYIKNQDFMKEAFAQVMHTPIRIIILCLVLANFYFLATGIIISQMTTAGDNRINFWQGLYCGYMCAFYRLATLGGGSGIAQVYYYSQRGIKVSRGTGLSLVEYTFQKITIGVFGVVSFLVLVAFGDKELLKYSKYMLAGVLLISFVCLALFLMAVSKWLSNLVIKIGRALVRKNNKLNKKLDKAEDMLNNFQDQGRIIWKNKPLFFRVVALDIFKFACWYAIPGVYLSAYYDVNIGMCLALMAVVNMVGGVMLAPSGVGTLEFVFAIFFGAIIKDASTVAAAIVIYRFFTWVVPFAIGLFPSLLFKGEKKEVTV